MDGVDSSLISCCEWSKRSKSSGQLSEGQRYVEETNKVGFESARNKNENGSNWSSALSSYFVLLLEKSKVTVAGAL